MKIGQKNFGRCVICGLQKELTKEHIPPSCTFNKNTFKLIKNDELLTSDEPFPWDGGKYKTDIKQGGLGVYTLCRTCNTQMGNYYTRAYKNFILILHSVIQKLQPKPNTAIWINDVKIKPLNIFKQIVSMFNSLNKDLFKARNFDIEKFLLNQNDKTFCSGVYFYLYLTQDYQQLPLQAACSLNGIFKTTFSSEIAHYPLGIIMSVDSELKQNDVACINDFLNFDYDKEANAELQLYIRERNLPFVANYKTKQELSLIKEEEKKRKFKDSSKI